MNLEIKISYVSNKVNQELEYERCGLTVVRFFHNGTIGDQVGWKDFYTLFIITYWIFGVKSLKLGFKWVMKRDIGCLRSIAVSSGVVPSRLNDSGQV